MATIPVLCHLKSMDMRTWHFTISFRAWLSSWVFHITVGQFMRLSHVQTVSCLHSMFSLPMCKIRVVCHLFFWLSSLTIPVWYKMEKKRTNIAFRHLLELVLDHDDLCNKQQIPISMLVNVWVLLKLFCTAQYGLVDMSISQPNLFTQLLHAYNNTGGNKS